MRSARTALSGPSNLCLRPFEDLDAGNLPGKVLISKHLHPQDA